MSNEILSQNFLSAAEAWICEGYALDIRYLAERTGSGQRIWDTAVHLLPLRPPRDFSFQIESGSFLLGQIQRFPESKTTLIDLLTAATNGAIDIPLGRLALPIEQPLDYFSEMSMRERWYSPLHLQVVGSRVPTPTSATLALLDSALRACHPPFDGLADAAKWLGLKAPGTSSEPPSVVLNVAPPCELLTDQCALANDKLHLMLHAHPNFDVAQVGLAIRAIPEDGLDARRQIAKEIKWGCVCDGIRAGVADIELPQAESVLAMLLIGTSTVRRQWFIDRDRARNNRLLAVQLFDKDLRKIRDAVLESSDSKKFEQGVAAILFLLGFAPSIQLEDDSPDLIVTTPGGQLAIVECTTRIADFATKVGKLVDRRGALSKSLRAGGHSSVVISVLVSRQPRDQIATQLADLKAQNIVLMAGEDLVASFDRVRHQNDPDQMLNDAVTFLTRPAPLSVG